VTSLEVGQRSLSLRGGIGVNATRQAIERHPSPYVQQVFGGRLTPPPLDPEYDSHAESSFARGLDALLNGYGLAPRGHAEVRTVPEGQG
jgi:hypothetical protein